MALYANGPGFQSTSVGTAPVLIFNTRGTGGTAIASGIVVHNPVICNTGTVPLYVSSGTVAATGGTATAAFILGAGVDLQPGQQMLILGTAVTGSTVLGGVFDVQACTSANVTSVVEAGYATQTLIS